MSIVSKDPIQLWLDTPIGAYEGYPTWGNNVYELLFLNKQEAKATVMQIMAKLQYDIGYANAQRITGTQLLFNGDDTFALLLYLQNNDIAIGVYNAT